MCCSPQHLNSIPDSDDNNLAGPSTEHADMNPTHTHPAEDSRFALRRTRSARLFASDCDQLRLVN